MSLRPFLALVSAAALAVALGACNLARPPGGDLECPDYDAAIRPALVTACASCHSGDAPPKSYVIGDYLQTVSRREDGMARVLPGSTDSLLLQAARGELSPHTALADEATLAALTDWNVRCRAAPGPITYHPKGWVTPTDLEQNHSRALRAAGYDLDGGTELKTCRQCHGEDLRGGKSGLSCEKCHTLKNLPDSAQTELECNTCHGDATSFAPPKALSGAWGTSQVGVGAHRTHLGGGELKKTFDCDVCHLKPEHNADEGHYRVNGVFQTGPAPVKLKYSGDGGTAAWSHAEATCTNTACHAPSAFDTAALTHQPKWTQVGTGQAKCGGCHGLPPASHGGDERCDVCHGPGYSKQTVDPARHLNQVVDLRGDGSDCAACHAGPKSASFFDLHGQTDAGLVTVGAHDAHLHASTFRGPLTCDDCHRVASALHSPGHIDSAGPAEVFPAGFAPVAHADNAQPTFTEATATCGSVYCHGAGTAYARDTSTGLVPTLTWTGPASQVACGTCHGLPPKDGTVAHTNRTMADCATCHGLTITDGGVLKFTVDPVTGARSSTHLDGRVTGSL